MTMTTVMEKNRISFSDVSHQWFNFELANPHLTQETLLTKLCDETIEKLKTFCVGNMISDYSPNYHYYYDLHSLCNRELINQRIKNDSV